MNKICTNFKIMDTIISEGQFSFQKGLNQVKMGDLPTVKSQIMMVLGIKSKQSWYMRLNGNIEPKVTEARAIEKIFHSYNITSIWGKE